MHIALISDIHGNLTAFNAVLEDIDKHHVEQIICLGDVTEGGPNPRECLHRLRERGIPVIMGNTDERILHPPPERTVPSEHSRIFDDIEVWNLTQLTPEDIDFVRTFHHTFSVDPGDGMSILCYHGSPQNVSGLIKSTTDWDTLIELFAPYADYTLLAGGHIHEQLIRPFARQTIINPGSVGLPFTYLDGGGTTRPQIAPKPVRADYAIIDVSNGRFSITMRRIPYSKDALIESARASGMPHADWFINDWE